MIYFRGCTAREKDTGISEACEKLLRLADVDYKVLDDEKCCGSVLFRTGFKSEGENQIKKNLDDFKGETILTSCAGCYKTFKNDYEGLNVIHISQLLEKLINENKLNINKSDLNVTYHDSCHLGRHCDEFDAARNVIKSAANLNELESNRENTICCGAGGGVKSAYPEISKEISKLKVEEIKNTNAELLISSCPFCKLNLNDISPVEVLDITEFIDRCLNE